MNTEIRVRGHRSGNGILCRAITTAGCEVKNTNFNGYCITFATKKQAKKALWEAYKYLRSKEPEFAKHGIFYSKIGSLRYDASSATIEC